MTANSASTFDTDDPPDSPVALASDTELDGLVDTFETVLVEFYTEGCGVCASMEPILSLVHQESDAVVATVNPRDDPPLIDRFDVQSVPLLVVFRDGEPLARVADGFLSVEEVLAVIEDSA